MADSKQTQDDSKQTQDDLKQTQDQVGKWTIIMNYQISYVAN